MTKRHDKTLLSQRDRCILLHGKTDMITAEVVHRRYFAGGSIEAARSAIRRLCGQAPDYLFVRPESLDPRRVYYCLTTRATRLLGISPKYADGLKQQGKVKRYAVSWFVHADRPGKRVLFDPHQFPDQFQVDGQHLPRHPFFIDETTGNARLGFILVDHNAHPRRIVQKTLKPLERFLHHGWFDDFIRQESFLVAVLTFSEFRKRAFEQELPRAIADQLGYPLSRLVPGKTDGLPIDVQVQVIPGLAPLVTLETSQTVKP